MISRLRAWYRGLPPSERIATGDRRLPIGGRAGIGIVLATVLLGCATPPKPPSAPVNGCDPGSATDFSQQRDVEIRFGDDYAFEYVPKCIRVSQGTRIHFRGNLESHPLVPGRFALGLYEEEERSPIREVGKGREASFVVTEAGAFGFLCYIHMVNGMMGAIFVE